MRNSSRKARGVFNTFRLLGEIEAQPQQHGPGKNGGQRVGLVPARDVRRGTVDRLEQAGPGRAQRSRGQHAQRTGEHRGFIRKNVAEDIAGENHVKL